MIRNNNTTLSYYPSSEELPDLVLQSKGLDFIPVDRKTTYIKEVNSKLKINTHISTCETYTNEPKLEELAIQSGIYSRFNIDQRIENNKFEDLYRLWMRNSLNRKIAKEVLLYKINQKVAGFANLGEKNKRGDIGIIAVDDTFRGKGIGKSLMESAEKWFSNHEYKLLQVITQGDNSCLQTIQKLRI